MQLTYFIRKILDNYRSSSLVKTFNIEDEYFHFEKALKIDACLDNMVNRVPPKFRRICKKVELRYKYLKVHRSRGKVFRSCANFVSCDIEETERLLLAHRRDTIGQILENLWKYQNDTQQNHIVRADTPLLRVQWNSMILQIVFVLW